MEAFGQEPGTVLIYFRMLISLVECIEYVVFLNRCLCGGIRDIPRFAKMLIYSIVVVVGGNLLGLPHVVKSAGVFALLIIFAAFLYKAPYHLVTFYTLLVFYIVSVSALIVGNLFAWVSGQDIVTLIKDDNAFMLHNTFALVLQIICIMAAHRYLPVMVTDNPKRFWVLLNLTLGFSYFLASVFSTINPELQRGYMSAVILLAILVFVAINICVIVIFNQLAVFYKREKRAALTGLQTENVHAEMMRLQDSQRELRRLRHDWDNQASAAILMISSGNVAEGLAALKAVTVPETAIEAYSGNTALDAVINLKAIHAEKNQVVMEIKVSQYIRLDADPTHVASVIANLLDNAIEAASALPSGQRFVHFSCHSVKDYLFITTLNQYVHEIVVRNGELATTKAPPSAHGIGLQIVRDICEQHGGSLELDYGNGEFKARAIMKIRSK